MPLTDTNGKKIVSVPCTHYLIQYQESQGQKGQEQVKALLDSSSKVNAMSLAFARKLGLHIRKTNIKAQKMDNSALEIFGMVIADLEVEDKAGRSRFFQETFLVADTKFEVILGMLFLKISNADISFGKGMLT